MLGRVLVRFLLLREGEILVRGLFHWGKFGGGGVGISPPLGIPQRSPASRTPSRAGPRPVQRQTDLQIQWPLNAASVHNISKNLRFRTLAPKTTDPLNAAPLASSLHRRHPLTFAGGNFRHLLKDEIFPHNYSRPKIPLPPSPDVCFQTRLEFGNFPTQLFSPENSPPPVARCLFPNPIGVRQKKCPRGSNAAIMEGAKARSPAEQGTCTWPGPRPWSWSWPWSRPSQGNTPPP